MTEPKTVTDDVAANPLRDYAAILQAVVEIAKVELQRNVGCLLKLKISFSLLKFLLVCTWFSVLALVAAGVYKYFADLVLAAAAVFALNGLALVTLLLYMNALKSSVHFQATLRQVQSLKPGQDNNDEP